MAGLTFVEHRVDGEFIRIFNGCRIAAHISERGTFEPESLAAWHSIVKPGTIAIDVGAYSGIYSILAARWGATVMAFEPMPMLAERFARNCSLNGVHCKLFQVAISDRRGSGRLSFAAGKPMTSAASLFGNVGNSIPVALATLDDLRVSNVSAVKIDVERAEPNVLRGGMVLLESERPAMLIEALDGPARRVVAGMLKTRWRWEALLDGRNMLMMPK